MSVTWSVREAKFPADLETFRSLVREYQVDMGENLCFQGFEEEVANLPGRYARPQGVVVLGFLNRVPVACIALRPLNDRDCEMKRLYVRPEARGVGIGRALVRRVLREARLSSYHTMKLDTLARMEPAIRLYESMGFRRTKPYTENPLEDVVYMERLV